MSELNQNIPPRILIVSNRLPVQITMVKGKLDVKQSIGGLATGMHPVHETYETLWIGWSGFSRSHFAPGKLKTINNKYQIMCIFMRFIIMYSVNKLLLKLWQNGLQKTRRSDY